MRAKIQQLLYTIRGSYWFLPALMALTAIIASQFFVWLDRVYGDDWLRDFWWASLNQPDGARSLLATVAGSMITVTGVTFSLTILAVSYATSHFGPRLLDNFMRDRGNQITLGVFVATFLYCLLVLRSVRTGQTSDNALETEVFVPQLAITIAIALTLASVGVLIFFIHHIPESISITHVLNGITEMIDAKTDDFFPERIGSTKSQPIVSEPDWGNGVEVNCRTQGYLQGVDAKSLMKFAVENELVVNLKVRPGDHLLENQVIAIVCQAVTKPTEQTPDADFYVDHIHSTLAIGDSRTPTQDIFFAINQFVEIAIRALSPGVNDPFTAIQCIDRLAQAMTRISQRHLPSRFRVDDDDTLRIVAAQPNWDQIVHAAFGQLAPYAAADANVSRHLTGTIESLVSVSQSAELNDSLRRFQATWQVMVKKSA
ncbi:DUF2254 domain-containing protein [Stieleria varia]|uniref:DUF2254 domain-containing protein n=1 Tax=Stieleria varia TaxID=2528005 RepID=A0A5C6A3B3_9BACT|nr:DUF2254 domain-containing protein [Stieleria varia]TWT93855.1 hypothetical protein Pla52n_56830 [Stieleria varia]